MHLVEDPHPHLYIVRSLPEWTELENLSCLVGSHQLLQTSYIIQTCYQPNTQISGEPIELILEASVLQNLRVYSNNERSCDQ